MAAGAQPAATAGEVQEEEPPITPDYVADAPTFSTAHGAVVDSVGSSPDSSAHLGSGGAVGEAGGGGGAGAPPDSPYGSLKGSEQEEGGSGKADGSGGGSDGSGGVPQAPSRRPSALRGTTRRMNYTVSWVDMKAGHSLYCVQEYQPSDRAESMRSVSDLADEACPMPADCTCRACCVM